MLKTFITENNGKKNWSLISKRINKSEVECIHRWQKVLNPNVPKPKKRRPWTKEEDELVKKLVDNHGPSKWTFIAEHLPGRIGKQCRERWHNHLNPAIKKDSWTEEFAESAIVKEVPRYLKAKTLGENFAREITD